MPIMMEGRDLKHFTKRWLLSCVLKNDKAEYKISQWGKKAYENIDTRKMMISSGLAKY